MEKSFAFFQRTQLPVLALEKDSKIDFVSQAE